MLNANDTWNKELVDFFELYDQRVTFHYEDYGFGRAGLHEYFNDLLKHATGDWIIYFCEDHFINLAGWDHEVRTLIKGTMLNKVEGNWVKKHERGHLDPKDVWVLVPKFDNVGAMNHIVSRGFIEAMGGRLGEHGWIDSYINDVMEKFPDRVLRFDDPMFHDFSHDHPNPMDKANVQSVVTKAGKKLPSYGSMKYHQRVKKAQEKIKAAL